MFGGKGPPGEEVASGGQLFQGERTGKLPEENTQGVENLKKTAHSNGVCLFYFFIFHFHFRSMLPQHTYHLLLLTPQLLLLYC